MERALFTIRIFSVMGTAFFMSSHSVKFIMYIEPNGSLAWLAAVLIEIGLISLAMMRSFMSRVLLVLLFIMSVLIASMPSVLKNEEVIHAFFQNKQIIQQLQTDLKETEKDFERGDKYTTKTLIRSRQLKDQVVQVLKSQTGDMALFNAGAFLLLVLILQGVSVYTAMGLKKNLSQSLSTVSLSQLQKDRPETQHLSLETSETAPETSETNRETDEMKNISSAIKSHNGNGKEDGIVAAATDMIKEEVLRLYSEGHKPAAIIERTGISRATCYRIIKMIRTTGT